MIPDYAYQWVWYVFLTILCIYHCRYLSLLPSFDALHNRRSNGVNNAIWLLLVVTIFFGLRPISTVFADMVGYASSYEYGVYEVSEVRNEPVWQTIMYICHEWFGLSTSLWFLVVAAVAFGFKFAACKKLLGNQIYTVFLFLLTSFSFWSNGVTIIRSNVGMAFALYGIALFIEGAKKNKILAILFFIIAFYSHTSTALLIGCFFLSRFFIKNVKWSIFIYVACIAGSLVLGSYFEVLFASLGFDERMSQFTTDVDYTGFSHAGFRWDFLAYSIVPILLGWYIVGIKKIKDKVYSILLNTYIISNAFWVLVIRAQFSDRFASISWTLYFLVLAYPLLKIPIWNRQPKKVVLGLWFQMGFLWFMQIYYALR